MSKAKFIIEDNKITFSKGKGVFSMPLNDECLWVVDNGFSIGGLIIKRYRVINCTPFLKEDFIGKKIKEAKKIIKDRKWKMTVIEGKDNNEIQKIFKRDFNK